MSGTEEDKTKFLQQGVNECIKLWKNFEYHRAVAMEECVRTNTGKARTDFLEALDGATLADGGKSLRNRAKTFLTIFNEQLPESQRAAYVLQDTSRLDIVGKCEMAVEPGCKFAWKSLEWFVKTPAVWPEDLGWGSLSNKYPARPPSPPYIPPPQPKEILGARVKEII